MIPGRIGGDIGGRGRRRSVVPRLLLVGILALSAYFAIAGGDYSIFDARRAQARLEARRGEVRQVRRQIDSLRARIDSLQHHPEVLERFARERFGFIREGEFLYRISSPPPAGAPGSPDPGRRAAREGPSAVPQAPPGPRVAR